MSKDYEREVQASETMIEVAMIRLLLARLGARSLILSNTLKLVGRWPLKEGNPWLHHFFGDIET